MAQKLLLSWIFDILIILKVSQIVHQKFLRILDLAVLKSMNCIMYRSVLYFLFFIFPYVKKKGEKNILARFCDSSLNQAKEQKERVFFKSGKKKLKIIVVPKTLPA